jgi:GMP synthase (glutamine-hydrolysing)
VNVPKTAVAVRHVAFEDLGSFEQDLRRAGYEIRYYDIGIDDLASVSTRDPDFLLFLVAPSVIRGGSVPIPRILHPFPHARFNATHPS